MTLHEKAEGRFADTERNRILNQCLNDLDNIVNHHDPDTDTSINNGVWGRLDKMAVQIEVRVSTALAAVEAENARMREALEHCLGQLTGGMDGIWECEKDPVSLARAALTGKEPTDETD